MTDAKSNTEKDIFTEDFQTCIDTLASIADRLVSSEDDHLVGIGQHIFHFCSWANGFEGDIVQEICAGVE